MHRDRGAGAGGADGGPAAGLPAPAGDLAVLRRGRRRGGVGARGPVAGASRRRAGGALTLDTCPPTAERLMYQSSRGVAVLI
ncbi:hypothetical protein FMM08_12480 [Quadrisphaera setariae]|uniref:Uncharacterized protein n=1 Tax=Quadrisphaera setariae TaxID=2593304 RepID=A0A5C8ZFG2_9ACTN|nr:hypothetical protein FMM08_12480 [Quadrisphaera setariae]